MCDPLLILIPAAGASSRMRGGDKLLEPVEGVPQLARIAQAALDTGERVRIALPPDRPGRQQALQGMAVELVLVPDATTGMAATLRAGAAGWSGAVMILPADMPELTAPMLGQMIRAHRAAPGMILRGASGARPGHPVIFPADLVPLLNGLTGDLGAQPIVKAHAARLQLVALPAQAAITDLDTPEDWARWRAGSDRGV